MANTILTPSVIAKESLRILRNSLVAGRKVHREFKKEFVKVGDTVTIRKPVKFEVSDGTTRVNQDVTEQSTSIVINKRKHISWNFVTQDLTLKIEEYSKRYIAPALNSLADQVDLDILALASDVYNAVGTAGTTPATFATLGDAAAKLTDEAVPHDQRCTMLNPDANWALADALKSLLNNDMNKDFVRKGMLGRIANSEVYEVQNISRITAGADISTGTPLVNGAGQTGSTLAVDGFTASTTDAVREGDVFTIAGVNAVNPVNKADTGKLRQFVVTADADSGATTGPIAAMAISPSITTSGPYQTVTAGPADNAALTFAGQEDTADPANLMFHHDAFALVTVPLELPKGASFKARATHDGLSVRVVNDYDIDSDQDIIRLDILYGVKTLYPELAVRIYG